MGVYFDTNSAICQLRTRGAIFCLDIPIRSGPIGGYSAGVCTQLLPCTSPTALITFSIIPVCVRRIDSFLNLEILTLR